MQAFLTLKGYLTVFVLVVLSGEIGLLAGAALSKIGAVTVPGVIAVGSISSFVGNMLYFYTGKVLWSKWGFLKQRLGKRVSQTMKIAQKYGCPLMLFARFFYGLRNIVPIALGIYQVPLHKFALYNLAGAVIWSIFFTTAGVGISLFLTRSITDLKSGVLWGLVSSILIAMLYLVVRGLVAKLTYSRWSKRATH